MSLDLSAFVSRCETASRCHGAQAQVADLLREVIEHPADLAEALSGHTNNVFFEKDGPRLVETRRVSVTAPGVVLNAPDVIHSIHNPRDTELRALHAYGGDLLATPRSTWDAESHEETAFDWRKVASE